MHPTFAMGCILYQYKGCLPVKKGIYQVPFLSCYFLRERRLLRKA